MIFDSSSAGQIWYPSSSTSHSNARYAGDPISSRSLVGERIGSIMLRNNCRRSMGLILHWFCTNIGTSWVCLKDGWEEGNKVGRLLREGFEEGFIVGWKLGTSVGPQITTASPESASLLTSYAHLASIVRILKRAERIDNVYFMMNGARVCRGL